MDIESYKKMLEAAHRDLESAMEQQEEVEKRISSLKQTIIALDRVCRAEAKTENALGIDIHAVQGMGFTGRCREVMKTAENPMTPVEVRDQLVRMGLDPNKYMNLMASVHRVLKRLLENHEIVKLTRPADGETVYFRTPIYRRRRRGNWIQRATRTETKDEGSGSVA